MTIQHPNRPDVRIEDIRDGIFGYTATLHEGTKQTPLTGTWALGVPLSWSRYTHTTPSGFRAGEYVNICGSWQI